ncbi:hypothetical protein [Streptomyces coelicoflavus]
MKQLLEFLGFLAVLLGATGLVHKSTEPLLALGGALFAAAESRGSG